MHFIKNCPHCGQRPTISRMLDDVVIECGDDRLMFQGRTYAQAIAGWNAQSARILGMQNIIMRGQCHATA